MCLKCQFFNIYINLTAIKCNSYCKLMVGSSKIYCNLSEAMHSGDVYREDFGFVAW